MSTRNQITWNRQQREIAQQEKRTLFAIGVDGRLNSESKTGCYITTGAVPNDVAVQMYAAVMDIYKKWRDAQPEKKTAKNKRAKASA